MWPFDKISALMQRRRETQMLRAIELLAGAERFPLPVGGRSSQEEPGVDVTMGNTLVQLDGLTPEIPFDMLDWLVRIAPVQQDINHMLTNLVGLANSGHSLMIDARSDAITEKAMDRLNAQAKTLYPFSAGIDGLVNDYLEQIAITGAISSEDVVNASGDGVQKVVLVPTPKIRFQLIDGDYRPFQKLLGGDLLPLNINTYRYIAFRHGQAHALPYGLPPMAAAIEGITEQRDMKKNIQFILKKFGLLGLVAYTLKAPQRRGSEADSEYEARAQSYLSKTLGSLKQNYLQGLLAKFEDHTIDHFDITGSAQGARDLWDLSREHLASSMGIDPLVLGMAGKSTESFANVTYLFLIRHANNIRRLVKRRMERTYQLDLLLAGVPVDNVMFKFNENPARKPLDEQQAEMNRVTYTMDKVRSGMISPDEGAQILGHDAWYDPSLIHQQQQSGMVIGKDQHSLRTFKYDSGLECYRYLRPSLGRINIPLNPPSKGEKELASEEVVRRTMKEFADKYLAQITFFLGEATADAMKVLESFLRRSSAAEFRSAEVFAQRAIGLLQEVFADAFETREAQAAIKSATKEIYAFYRLQDSAAFIEGGFKFTMDSVDRRTLGFVQRLDRFHLSKWISNRQTERSLMNFLQEEYIEKGAGLFGRQNEDNIREFISMAVDRIEPLTEFETRRIINTAVQRMRNWAHIGQLDQAGIKVAQIFNPSPEAEICKFMVGQIKYLPVAQARESVDEMAALSPDAFAARLTQITPDLIAIMGIESATRQGYGYPPYHPNCKTRLIATERESLSAQEMADSKAAIAWLTGNPPLNPLPWRGNGTHKRILEHGDI